MGPLLSSGVVNETRECIGKNCSAKWKGTLGNCRCKFRRCEKLGKYEKNLALGKC